jgi:predicted kinase
MSEMSKLLAMSGLPRSGKSTIAKQVYMPMGYTVVSPDDFRLTMFGQRYYAPGEPLLWAVIYNVVDTLLRSGNRVILDATNLIIDRRHAWVKRGAEFVVVDTPEKECIRRAKATKDAYIIPVIESMASRAEAMQTWERVAAVHKWESR